MHTGRKTIYPARFPKKGLLRVADDGREHTKTFAAPDANRHIPVEKGDFDPAWYDPQNISVRLFHWWTEENLNIDSFDAGQNVIYTSNCRTFDVRKENTEYFYENVREALTSPDEYYFDRNSRELYCIPPEKDNDFRLILPRLGVLVHFDSAAANVTLRGLRFCHSGAHVPVAEHCYDLRETNGTPVINHAHSEFYGQIDTTSRFMQSAQGAVQLPGAVMFAEASDCTLENCEIDSCNWYAVVFAHSSRRISLLNNHFHHLGGGGITVSGGNFDNCQQNPALHTSHIIISGNHIHHCGERFHSALGIIITQASSCLIEKNHIHDLYYSGISCGWTWGYQPTMARENRILNNRIHDLGKGLLSDMGGIYTLGIQPGTRVSGNVIYGIKNRYYGGWGLYADEGSAHIIFENNIVYDCSCDGFHQHYGRENILRHNIFAVNHICAAGIGRDADDGYDSPGVNCAKALTMVNNLFICKDKLTFKLVFDHLLERDLLFSDNNIFWNISGTQEFSFQSGEKFYSFARWQKMGLDRHSIIADPGLRNPEKGDFRLKKDSILHEYGFGRKK